jgi:uncharacterized protein (TIGR02466 family)
VPESRHPGIPVQRRTLARRVADDLLMTYGTLLLQRRLDAMLPHNDGLADYALRLRAAAPGETRSNVGGWHSDGNIFERKEPVIGVLEQHLQAAIQHVSIVAKQIAAPRINFKATLEGWINVNGPGDYNIPHYHPGNTWSGVYYIRTGSGVPNRPASGRIEFIDPRTRCDSLGPKDGLRHSGSIWIAPVDGMLLIFPSYLEHYVHPYQGAGERITLAFNSLVEELTPLP